MAHHPAWHRSRRVLCWLSPPRIPQCPETVETDHVPAWCELPRSSAPVWQGRCVHRRPFAGTNHRSHRSRGPAWRSGALQCSLSHECPAKSWQRPMWQQFGDDLVNARLHGSSRGCHLAWPRLLHAKAAPRNLHGTSACCPSNSTPSCGKECRGAARVPSTLENDPDRPAAVQPGRLKGLLKLK